MRISDLSSDVCSSDLVVGIGEQALRREQEGRKVRGQQFVQLRIGGGPIDQGSEIVADNHLTGGGGLRHEQLHFLDEEIRRDRSGNGARDVAPVRCAVAERAGAVGQIGRGASGGRGGQDGGVLVGDN